MSLDQLRTPLRELLDAITSQPTIHLESIESIEAPVFVLSMSQDLSEPASSRTCMLTLTGDVARKYWDCIEALLQQGVNGELEHLAEREIERALERLVSETWMDRDTLQVQNRHAKVEAFITTHRRPQEPWEVFWEVKDLSTIETFSLAGVDFLPFEIAMAERQRRREGDHWQWLDKDLSGKTLARTTVYAVTQKLALERAKAVIDDALNVLRVVLLKARTVPDQQRLQSRGLFYLACRSTDPDALHGGGEHGFRSYPLGVGDKLLDLVRRRTTELEPAIGTARSAEIREPMLRAIHWIGSSVLHDDPDDRVVDLCTALECLLCSMDERGAKAAPISVRYMLAGHAIGENVYFVHPLQIFELYGLRNRIVHGAARRVCGIEDVKELRYVALDAIHRMTTLIQTQPDITSLSSLFEHIRTVPALSELLSFLDRDKIDANHPVYKLTKKWLKETSSISGRLLDDGDK